MYVKHTTTKTIVEKV